MYKYHYSVGYTEFTGPRVTPGSKFRSVSGTGFEGQADHRVEVRQLGRVRVLRNQPEADRVPASLRLRRQQADGQDGDEMAGWEIQV